ncbi:hypothetical protein [Phormidium sp. FACHB-1136]|uniref:hypothetical protein n=1 Tax=Phormidium sp. FACHB-1136 TaxID=2692848 RepID=UPI001F5595B8|nr:hypothetical protein [Phormidium sp. FACHB-1136]
MFAQSRMQGGRIEPIAPNDGHQALLVTYGMVDLLTADLGHNGVGADYEEKGISGFDARFDFGPPVGGKGNVFPINPCLVVAGGEGLVQDLNEGFVLAGIGDENIRHRRNGMLFSLSHWPFGIVSNITRL